MNGLWIAVPYLLVGLAIAVWRWPRERELRAAIVQVLVQHRTERPDWVSQLRAHANPGYSEESRARLMVNVALVVMGLIWPVVLVAELIVKRCARRVKAEKHR
jgi:hypothetical protein